MDARGWVIVLVGVAAVAEDLRSRRISNWTSGGALLAGVLLHTVQRGVAGLGQALIGAVVGFGVFLVFYLLGGMGGGDIMLMTGFGALLGGWKPVLEAALLTAVCGALMAVLYLAGRWLWRKLSRTTAASGSGTPGETIPYGPAITAGVWLALLAGR